MAGTEAPSPLLPGDAEAGLVLSDEAGWNQTVEDWRFFIEAGIVVATRSEEGRVVATAALLPYGAGCWVSLVLVTPAFRRRGLATRLVQACLDRADADGRQAWLDATPAGAPVYEKLGFAPAGRLMRMRRPGTGLATSSETAGHTIAAFQDFDHEALGLDRSALLAHLCARPGAAVHGDADACCLVRGGRLTRQVGPLYARSDEAAIDLATRIAAAEPGELAIDLHVRPSPLKDRLLALGFREERPFLRMWRGTVILPGAPTLAYAGAGPEYG